MKENESIESIVAEMRRREKSRYYPKVARNIMHQYADRIEAAWKREREELDKRISDLEAYAKLWTGRADELRLKCDEFYAKAKPIGNAAAMRESLENSNGLLEELSVIGEWGESAREQIAENNAALSAPPRQCDVGTAGEQAERYDKFCDIHDCRSNCPLFNTDSYCKLAWAQMPYAKEGAGK